LVSLVHHHGHDTAEQRILLEHVEQDAVRDVADSGLCGRRLVDAPCHYADHLTETSYRSAR
jgi:uncharacterized membrane-anchored protein